MKHFLTLFVSLAFLVPAIGQESYSREEFLRRYNNLTERVGASGVGVETLLNKWEEAWPDDVNHRLARFSFSFNRCQSSRVVPLEKERYMGNPPLLTMTDSLGKKVNYFEVYDYDDELFADANSAITRAISAQENRLDWRFLKINALMAYEKEEPEMTLQELKSLADYHFKRKPDWEHETMGSVSPEQFNALMQDYCAALFQIGSPKSSEAFRLLSEYLLGYCKEEPMYLDNLGSYYLVRKDYKKARKYFDQVLKKHPEDMTALRNCILMARTQKDVKLEKKYRALMARYGETETDRKSAQTRLDAYGKK